MKNRCKANPLLKVLIALTLGIGMVPMPAYAVDTPEAADETIRLECEGDPGEDESPVGLDDVNNEIPEQEASFDNVTDSDELITQPSEPKDPHTSIETVDLVDEVETEEQLGSVVGEGLTADEGFVEYINPEEPEDDQSKTVDHESSLDDFASPQALPIAGVLEFDRTYMVSSASNNTIETKRYEVNIQQSGTIAVSGNVTAQLASSGYTMHAESCTLEDSNNKLLYYFKKSNSEVGSYSGSYHVTPGTYYLYADSMVTNAQGYISFTATFTPDESSVDPDVPPTTDPGTSNQNPNKPGGYDYDGYRIYEWGDIAVGKTQSQTLYPNNMDVYELKISAPGTYKLSCAFTGWENASSPVALGIYYGDSRVKAVTVDPYTSSGSTTFNALYPGNYTIIFATQNNKVMYGFIASLQSVTAQPYWDYQNGNWYYRNPNGTYWTGWHQIDGKKYYFSKNSGAAAKGLVVIDGKRYYFNPSTSEMVTGWVGLGGNAYYFTDSGAAASGLVTLFGDRYYFGPSSNKMATGWQTIGGYKYYFSSATGKAASGLVTIGGYRYYFGPSSNKMATGWQTIGGNKYYFSSATGKAASGLVTIGGYRYYFGPSSNKMATGWQTIGGYRYYFSSVTGRAASGFVTIGDAKYYFGPSTNKMATGKVTIGSKTYTFDSKTGKLIG